MMLKRYTLVLLNILCFPIVSFGEDYRHFIWAMSNKITVNDMNIEYNDSTTLVTAFMNGGLNGIFNAKNVYQNCKGSSDILSATLEKTAWIIIQDKVYAGKVPIYLDIDTYNSWTHPGQPQIPGYNSKINQVSVQTTLGACLPLHSIAPVNFYWKTPRIFVSMPAGSLAPGVYRIPVEYYYAFEENKFTDVNHRGPSANVPSLIVGGLGRRDSFTLIITVKSKCDFNSNRITLTHDITLGDKSNYKSDLSLYSIYCGSSTPVKMELIGTTIPAGKSVNFTKCDKGDCELQFSNGKTIIEEKIQGKKNYVINSTFHPYDETKTGKFQGSGVLKVTIQ